MEMIKKIRNWICGCDKNDLLYTEHSINKLSLGGGFIQFNDVFTTQRYKAIYMLERIQNKMCNIIKYGNFRLCNVNLNNVGTNTYIDVDKCANDIRYIMHEDYGVQCSVSKVGYGDIKIESNKIIHDDYKYFITFDINNSSISRTDMFEFYVNDGILLFRHVDDKVNMQINSRYEKTIEEVGISYNSLHVTYEHNRLHSTIYYLYEWIKDEIKDGLNGK